MPLVTAAGVTIPIISGFSTPSQNKTLEKFSSIPGFKTSLSLYEFHDQLLRVGAVISHLLEDITKDYQEINCDFEYPFPKAHQAFIQTYILSQKLAFGVNRITFDIKVGEGSFLNTLREARNFGFSLRRICKRMNIDSSYILSNLDQPLGQAIGNSLEVREAIEVLKGKGPLDVLKLALEIGSEMLFLADMAPNKTEAKICLKSKIEEGKALDKFKEIIKAQKGIPLIVDDYDLLPLAKVRKKVFSLKEGYIVRIKMREIALLQQRLSTGQKSQMSSTNHDAGFLIFKKLGDKTLKGDVLAEVYLNEESALSIIQEKLREAFLIVENPPDFKPFIIEKIGKK